MPSVPAASRRVWRNWARNQQCAPSTVATPRSEDELAATVAAAADRGVHVRCVGSGHSFTPLACTDGVLIDLAALGSVRSVDHEVGTVTVDAGMPLWRLNRELAAHGLALENLGDIAYQTVAGATQTATHGTGARLRNLSSAIVGLRLVTADGSVLDASPTSDADVLDVVRVGLGAFGVLSQVTLRCVPAFDLHAVADAEPIDPLLERLDDEVDGHDHFELFWIPNTRWALTKRNDRTDERRRPRPRWRAWRDDVLYDNVLFGAMCRVGRWRNQWIPALAKRLPAKGRADYVDASYRVFASPRRVRFYEMEYAIERSALRDALGEVRALVAGLGMQVSFPVEVRFVAGDDIPLSTAYGRDTAYVAVHVYRGTPYDHYFQGVEEIMDGYGGRPHWGKLHFQSARTLAPRYPRWDDAQAMRARLDPTGVFSTPYLERVLGPAGNPSGS